MYQAAEDTWDTDGASYQLGLSADGVRDVCETMQTETVELFISSAAKDTTWRVLIADCNTIYNIDSYNEKHQLRTD